MLVREARVVVWVFRVLVGVLAMHLSVSAAQFELPRLLRLLGASLVGFLAFAHSAFAAAPVISGTPATWVYVGSTYSFTPT